MSVFAGVDGGAIEDSWTRDFHFGALSHGHTGVTRFHTYAQQFGNPGSICIQAFTNTLWYIYGVLSSFRELLVGSCPWTSQNARIRSLRTAIAKKWLQFLYSDVTPAPPSLVTRLGTPLRSTGLAALGGFYTIV